MHGRRHVHQSLHAEQRQQPASREHHEQVGVLERPDETAQYDEAEQEDQEKAEEKPELFAGDGEDEVGVRVGQRRFDVSLPRSAAEETAGVKGFQGASDLIAFAAGRIEELIDPLRTWPNMA